MGMQLGYKGEQLDLLIRSGANFGVHEATMVNPDGTPVDLSNCVIRGGIAKSPQSPVIVALDVTIAQPEAGVYRFGIGHAATALLPSGRSEDSPESRYVWQMELIDNAGQIFPLYYGVVSVFKGLSL
jgi:hypothetical protein